MSNLIYPKPRDWNELEDIIADVFSRKINDANLVRFTRFGRQGQKQYGVDVTGFNGKRLIGFQSKNHTGVKKISQTEIKKEIKKAEGFRPVLSEFIIVTSADRDSDLQKFLHKENKARKSKHKFQVGILFWEEVCDLILQYPDLTYKYFTRHFPPLQFEQITLPGLHTPNRIAMSISLDGSLHAQSKKIELIAKERGVAINSASPYHYSESFTVLGFNKFVARHLEELVQERITRPQYDQYRLSIGFSTFPNSVQSHLVDLGLDYSHLMDRGEPKLNFQKAAKALADFQLIVASGVFSKELTIYLQARLPYAFLLGWMFRKVTKFNLNLVAGNQVWTTKDLPCVPANIRQDLPEVTKHHTKEVVVILNFTPRSITQPVKNYLRRMKFRDHILLGNELIGGHVTSAAHALAIAREVSTNLKNISDQWDASKIHLFMAAPASLAVLIAYHINGIKPINLYFFNKDRTSYELAGVITNNT